MALLDVNALVALAWDSHVHYASMRRWFHDHHDDGWSTCAVTEAGFVRVSANRRVLPSAVSVNDARRVLAALRQVAGHRFVANDVSPVDRDFPHIVGHQQVTDAQLLTLAQRNGMRLLTFDRSLAALADDSAVEVLAI